MSSCLEISFWGQKRAKFTKNVQIFVLQILDMGIKKSNGAHYFCNQLLSKVKGIVS
jgi:hypothetical protein